MTLAISFAAAALADGVLNHALTERIPHSLKMGGR